MQRENYSPGVGAVLVVAALCAGGAIASGQAPASRGCSAAMEFDPTLIANPAERVSFRCASATPYQAIQAVGRQARVPIGIVLGRDTRPLLQRARSFALHDVDVKTALRDAVRGTGYSLRETGGVWVLVAGDLSKRQDQLMHLRYREFRAAPGSPLFVMGQYLTMVMQATLQPGGGYVLGGISSTNEEGFTLPATASETTEEIANRIIRLGPRGMWVLRVHPTRPKGRPQDAVEIESYQHYTNRPLW